MKIINFDQVRNLKVSPSTCFEWAADMVLHKKDTVLPPKTHLDMDGGVFCNVMPCLVDKWGGVKVVTRYPERKPSLDSKILLFDTETGTFAALIDGNWITAMRTGAVAAHSIVTFGKSGFSTIGMIGLGNVARATLLVLADVLNDRNLKLKLLRFNNEAELYIERFKSFKNLEFQIVDSVEECIRGSDVVVSCATYFANDIAADEYFDEGVLLVPVHTRGFTNCDLFFDKVYADDTGHVNHFKNFSRFRQFAEVTDVVNGLNTGRENDKERILVYNIGVSMHDIHFAAKIYELMSEQKSLFESLPVADMKEPNTNFWV